ncbi:aminoacyltransferase [Macrococcus equipercicus]|uniref:Aminoacyltransferase n=1 Tax=Macrococcus equipercicus TaxID=69967 RepID=A0A9Q9BUY5_9STAP|nr:aminoacyltransferase [Macrococcus equipercicus]UTH12787.1 aminoacyltransferase [Macrococcus equipercicus]
MQFTELTVKEYSNFMSTTPLMSHYFQAKENIKNREDEGYPVVLLGVKHDDEVIAASLFSKIPMFGSYMYYSNRGPVLDFRDTALVTFYFTSLDQYLKRHQCLSVKVDPYWLYKTYDKDVNYKEANGTNQHIIELMKSLGYDHSGYTRGYTADSQVRWMSVLYLDNETPASIMKQFDSQRKRNVKKSHKYGVKVRLLGTDEVEQFLELYKETEERTGMIARDDDYFRQFADNYGSKVIMPLAYIDLDDYIRTTSAELNGAEAKRDQMMMHDNKSDKLIKKIAELDKQIDQLQQTLLDTHELKKTDGSILNLAAGMYFENNFELNYFSGGSSSKYSHFMGPYAMHWHMINYCFEHGYHRYNFYGVSGDFSESGEDYGVYQFKRGFNAQIEELVGDFTKTINKPKQKLYQAAGKAGRGFRKVQRKLLRRNN